MSTLVHTRLRDATPPSAKTLTQLQDDIIQSARRGYSILISAAGFFVLMGALEPILPARALGLAWIFGMMVIFPAGVILGRLVGARAMTTDNPLGTLGGL